MQSSFYTDGGVSGLGTVVSNDVPPRTGITSAPSAFYPGGTVYTVGSVAPDILSSMLAAQAAAATSATNASSSASAAASSASSMTTAFAGFLGTATPLMDGTAAPGTSTSKYAREDHVHPTDTSRAAASALASYAPLASPALTGVPTAPTATVGTNTTQLATTAFVLANGSSIPPATVNPLIDGTAAVGVATKYAREDHVHPTDTSRAPLASPGFTGAPTAATAAVDTNTTQLATTAFVLGQAASASPLALAAAAVVGTSTRFARADHVHPYDASAWTTYTATLTPDTGAFTTTTQSAAYQVRGKTVHWRARMVITAHGTASGGLTISLPGGHTLAGDFTPACVEFASMGQPYYARGASGSGSVLVLNNIGSGWVNTDGRGVLLSGTYEIT